MIVDSSALVSMILAERGSERLVARVEAASRVIISAPTVVESLIVLARRFQDDPTPVFGALLRTIDADVIPFTDDHWPVALRAFMRYGKGRHPAALNFGDCLTYAAAKLSGEPLLYVGQDFAKTDIKTA